MSNPGIKSLPRIVLAPQRVVRVLEPEVRLRASWEPAVVVASLLAMIFALALWHNISANQGQAIFALDDPYIHLAMARNLAAHGIWGVTPDGFSATSSAPFYTALLSLVFLVAGASPFWLWLFAAAGGLGVAVFLSRRITVSFGGRGIAVLLGLWSVIVAGIPELMFTGMEHALHAVTVLWVAALLERYAATGAPGRRTDLMLLAYIAAACGLRYEGLFLLPFVALYLFWQRRRVLAITAVSAGLLPTSLMAAVQSANGSMLLPNTIMIKGVSGLDHSLSFVTRFFHQVGSPYISVLLALAALGLLWGMFGRQELRRDHRLASSGLFITVVSFHALLAHVDRRYISYAVALGIWAVIPWIAEWTGNIRHAVTALTGRRRQLFMMVVTEAVLCVALLPFGERLNDLGRLAHIGQDIYAQQYQVARFFSTAYADETVALNDIGTTAWAGGNRILDLWGLSDAEVARKRLGGAWTADAIRDAAATAGVNVAAVYPAWFTQFGGLPGEWTPVGSWQLPPGIQLNAASPQVVFYATSRSAATALAERLRMFASQLPAGVVFTPFF